MMSSFACTGPSITSPLLCNRSRIRSVQNAQKSLIKDPWFEDTICRSSSGHDLPDVFSLKKKKLQKDFTEVKMLPKEIWFWFHEDLVITASQKQTKVSDISSSLFGRATFKA